MAHCSLRWKVILAAALSYTFLCFPQQLTFDKSFSIVLYKQHDFISANEVMMWAGNNGMSAHDPTKDGSGLYWPGGKNAFLTSVFADGLVWGGVINKEVRFNGNTYRDGLTPGRILQNNIPSYPYESRNRIFKIKKGWEYLPESDEKNSLRADYEEWPGYYGAPFVDIDNDKQFNPGIDKPAFIGDEVLFYTANDLDTITSKSTYGSLPMGLEFQTTIWAYDSSSYLKDVIFKRYLVINKGANTIDSMYFGYWSDDDLGFAGDDFIGCDTSLNIGFTYNADNNDEGFYNSPPPAVAHMFLQGPVINSVEDDSAKFKNRWNKGYKNLDLSSFTGLFKSLLPGFNDPDLGVYKGTLEFYNLLTGYDALGYPYLNPITNQQTKFALPGDPEKGTGWYEGPGWPGGPNAGDRRFLLSSGPFTFAPGDTQEVVIAVFMAKGTNNLNSVTELKNTSAKLQYFWKNVTLNYSEGETIYSPVEPLPDEYILYQNYPNPFNPVTTIKYDLPEPSEVELKVYDILGREISVLVNMEQTAGTYKVQINSSKIGLSSGIYVYRIKTNNYISSKKMLLIK